MPRFRRASFVLSCLFVASSALAQDSTTENWCDRPGEAPDVIVGDLQEIRRWGAVGGITAFSIGTTSCNVGTCWLNWLTGNGNPNHPTIGGNAFRLENGRFEHIGQSWLKHGFYALSQNVCSPDCLDTDGEHLGVNCSDPYSADLNASQRRLGPKFEVNASTGRHPHPVTNQSLEGDEIFKRLQIHDVDIDPAAHPTARYFVEAQYITADDALAGNHQNNGSYRSVEAYRRASGNLDLRFNGPTMRERPAIQAWADNDPGVMLEFVEDSTGGRFYVASKATQNADTTWHYEYAVQNTTSDRAGGWFEVPIPTGSMVANKAFHDVDYHSGEPLSGTDWRNSTGMSSVFFYTDGYDVNQNGNALRWGTLYNFRFDSPAAPGIGLVKIGLFKPGLPGTPDSLVVLAAVPGAGRGCDGDGSCDPGEEDCVSCPGECSGSGPDNDGDGAGWCVDCNDNLPVAWGTAGEVPLLYAQLDGAGAVELDWDLETPVGGSASRYEVVRSTNAADFSNPACLREADPTARVLVDEGSPVGGSLLFYLARVIDPCTGTAGPTGADSFGRARTAARCP